MEPLSFKNQLLSIATGLFVALSFLAPMQARAAIIDFTAMPNGNISVIGDATFSLAGAGQQGDPTVNSAFGGGLWNSSDAASYPTNSILRVDFASDVTGLNWTFNNHGGKSTTFTIYDSLLNVLATSSNSSSSGFQAYDFSGLSDVRRIDWNNNGNNWLFALGRIEYEPTSVVVPEPASIALIAFGVIGLGFLRRRKNI
jgi:hypothetical protein